MLSTGLTLIIVAIGVVAASVTIGLSAWRSMQESERRAAVAWQKGTDALQSEAKVRTAMGEVLLELSRGLRDVEIGDPDALSETFGRIGAAIRESATDPSVEVTAVERTEIILREMAETLLQVDELEDARALVDDALRLAAQRLDSSGSSEDAVEYALTASLSGRIALAADNEEAARKELEDARQRLTEAVGENPGGAAGQAAMAATLQPLAQIEYEAGEKDAAVATARSAAELWREATASGNPPATWQEGRARTLEVLAGWHQDRGEVTAAAAAAAQALEARRALVEARPASNQAKQALARALFAMGQSELAAGRPVAARDALREGYALKGSEGRATAGMSGRELDRLEILAVASAEAGDAAVGVQMLQDAVHVRRQEVQRDPSSEEAKLNLAESLIRLGDARARTAALGAALEAYEGSLRLLEFLDAEESGEPRLETALASTWESIGRLRFDEGEPHGALGYFDEALKIRRKLAKAEPDNLGRQTALAQTLENMGDGSRSAGLQGPASGYYKQAVELRRQAMEAESESQMRRRDLAHSLIQLAGLELKRGNTKTARPIVSEVTKLAETLEREGAINPSMMREVASSVEQLGDLAMADGEPEQAAERYRQALELRRKLAEGDPARADWPIVVAQSYDRIGDALRASGDKDGAAQAYTQCADPLREIFSGQEESARVARHLGVCLYKLAVVTEGEQRTAAETEAQSVLGPLDEAGVLPDETASEIEELRSSLTAG